MVKLSFKTRLFCTLVIASLLCFTTNIGSLYAQNQKSDEWKKTPITLKATNVPLGQLLEMVAQKANAKVVFQKVALQGIDRPTTITVKDQPLNEVIQKLIGDQNIIVVYDINREIIIRPEKEEMAVDSRKFNIGGMVIDKENGEPLMEAMVVITDGDKNTSTGVKTDINGKFNLMVQKKSVIRISCLGYEPVSLQITTPKTDMKIVLSPSSFEVGEVVVTGLSKRKKESFTGGYVTVKGDELRKLAPDNVLKALQFFDPSFKIVENNRAGSDPNAQPEFIMRGDQSLGNRKELGTMDLMLDNVSSRPNTPLFILDGFITPLSRVLQIDPERVENITILKDAAATAIYGSRASNGVIVIETKTAPDGALNISYNNGFTIEMPDLTDYNMMNAAEKLAIEHRAKLYTGDNPNALGNTELLNRYNMLKRNVLAGVNTYWLSQPLRTAIKHRHSLTAAGGTEVFRYSLGVNAAFNPGVMKGSSNNNTSVNFSMTYRKERVTVGANINLSENTGNNSPYGSFSEYVRLNPYYKNRTENGEIPKELDNFQGNGYAWTITNPLYNANVGIKNFRKNMNISTGLNLEYRLLDNLRITELVSYVRGMARSEEFRPANHTMFANETDKTRRGKYTKNVGEMTSWSNNLGLNYNLPLNKHLISLNANWTVSEDRNNYVNLSGRGYPSVHMDDFIFGRTMDNNPTGTESISRSMGLIGQVSYMYDNRYAADFAVNSEITSIYANHEITPFWSVGARWNAYQEKWLQGIFSNLVLRANFGVTGDQNFSPSESTEYYTFSGLMKPYHSFESLGAKLVRLHNPTLQFAKTENFSLALECGVLDNRLNFSISHYNSITRRMITDYDLAPSTGFESQKINSGELQNIGFDASVNFIAYRNVKKQLNWTIGLNANHNVNKIRKISAFLRKINEAALRSPNAPTPILQEGHSTTTLYAVRSLGIDPATGKEVFLTKDGRKTYDWSPSNKVIIGDQNPKISGNLTSALNWRDFSCNIGISYRFGGIMYNSTLVDKIENANIAYNLDKRAAEDRWEKPRDITKYKELQTTPAGTHSSTRFIMRNNEVTLGSFSLGYRMRGDKFNFLRKMNIDVLSLNFATSNLLRISTIKQERGLDYPFARSYSLNMGFIFK